MAAFFLTMPQPTSPVPWNEIRDRFMAGESLRKIAATYQISHVAIHRRSIKEGWLRDKKQWQAVTELTPQTHSQIDTSRDTPETRALILSDIQAGLTFEQTADHLGIHRETLLNWRKADPELARQVRQAQGLRVTRRVGRVEKAGERGDWHADRWLLEHDPYTAGQFRDEAGRLQARTAIQINVNVPRATSDATREGDEIIVIQGSEPDKAEN